MGFLAAEPKPHPEWRLLLEAFTNAGYGTLIEHADAARIMNLKYGTRRYYTQIRLWRRAMLNENHRAIKIRVKKGYEVVKPDDYTDFSRNRFIQGRRRVKESVRIASVAPIDKMSGEQAQKHANHLAWMAPVLKVLNKIERNTRPALLAKQLPDLPRLKS